MDNILAVETYYIVFTNAKHNGAFLRHLKKGFQHVFAVKKSFGKKFWIAVNPMTDYMLVDIIPTRDYPLIRDVLVDKTATVLECEVTIREKKGHRIHFISCVETIKALLGIRAFWVITPYQLYKYLKKGG